MSQKVLLVLTSHDTLGNTKKETGFYLPEVTHQQKTQSLFKQLGKTISLDDYVRY